MDTDKLTVEEQGHILLMGLNRPAKLNAFDVSMYLDLARAYGRLHSDPALRCGLLFAHGRHFTAGLDLAEWAPYFAEGRFPKLPEGAVDPFGIYGEQVVEKPVVMAVQGICYTIGLEIMLAADVRVAASDTRFGQIEVKRGIFPAGGATIRLPQEIGWGNAMRYLLTADEISAAEAYRLGLVQEVTEPGLQFDRALSLAGTIARQAPLGVQATLRSARLARAGKTYEAVSRFLPEMQKLLASEDAREGLQSFLERRAAVFQGR